MIRYNLLFLLLILVYSCGNDTTNNTISTKDKPTGTIYFEGPDNYEGIFFMSGPGFPTNRILKTGSAPNVLADSSIIYLDSGEIRKIDKSFKNVTSILKIGPQSKSYRSGFERLDYLESSGMMAYEGAATSIGMVFVINSNADLVWTAASDKTGEGYRQPKLTGNGKLLMAGLTNNPGIYSMDLSNGVITKIGGSLTNPTYPAMSPDLSTIAFTMNNNIYFMNPDGSGVTQKTFDTYGRTQPVWSPDSKWIVCDDFGSALYFFKVDGSLNFKIENNSSDYPGFPGYYGGKICWVK